ncbi:DUF1801 domain-containing protein [Flavobacterium sp.]|uniref:DUF1801 domain-containing protein n=1 Tax=Flavobacterium sp. TaxID=239 RepID=UPI0012219234|nr:DUF1801 domain-containing protein [Flavobacterium sp.]RZJ72443.1 MAG: DUF1801 domain-containing protein [Flavobacterium sp.]
MGKTPLSDSEKVDQYIAALDATSQEIVRFLRELFLTSDSEISEHIKWNSPAFYFNGEMAEFDPKEYKRDLAVINLHRGKLLVVFPTGNKIDPQIGLNGKDYPDGRKIVEILNIGHTKELSDKLQSGVKDWLSRVDRNLQD